MARFRYAETSERWYKGNAHIHSTASDGGWTFAQLATNYRAAGYDFLFRTDHWVASDVASDPAEYPLLWLDGIELDGSDATGSQYHVVCLGRCRGISRDMTFVSAMESARSQGAMLILAHPAWMGNREDDVLRWGFDGVEVYNYVCQWLNGKGDSMVYWNLMLRQAPAALSLAVDDAHTRREHPGWNGGWVMVNAPELGRDAILESLRAGRFYSSCGPEFLALELQGNRIRIRTSPVRFARLVGAAWCGNRLGSFDGALLTEASFALPTDWPYVYLEIEDAAGRRAWTNALFVG